MSEQESVTTGGQTDNLLSSNIPNLAKYMNFIGLLQIIGGALYCLTIIGALIGVPVIYMGIRLREAADGFKKYLASGSKDDLIYTIDKQTRAFFIQFVLTIIGLAFFGIYLIVIIGLLASGSLF
ncbi:MAG: DUF5362 family protein [Bacteroidota bacterium]